MRHRRPRLLHQLSKHERTYILLDLENILGPIRLFPIADWRSILGEFNRIIARFAPYLLVVGTGPRLLIDASESFPQARRVCQRGINGADLALLKGSRQIAHIAKRFSRVIIASGDHIFTERASAFVQAGLDVGVLSRTECLSRRLSQAACWSIGMDLDRQPPVVA